MDKEKNFVHLHVHTEYSLLDGAAPIKKLVKKAKELGMSALAITDHGVMYGAVDFYKAACEAEIKPIIGCEVYVAPRSRHDKQHTIDSSVSHLILLAKNNNGYHNLVKMVSKASIDGFYYKPRVDRELIERYGKDMVCLSACLAGEIPKLLLGGDYEKAKQTALWYQSIFGKENYFIELQDHGIADQKRLNPMLIKLAREIGAPLVCTNDIHYIQKSDAPYQDVLMCIQTAKTVDDTDRMSFETEEFYLKSQQEMTELFSYIPEAVENTSKIAAMCSVSFDFDKTYLPKFDVPDGMSAFEYLKKLCMEGLKRCYNPVTEDIIERLGYELDVINKMGYVDYFLIVWDFIKFAKDNKIPVGPGRGSGAGSIVAHSLNITTIDPLKYNLLFERFLNPERISMPDIDTDFCIDRRGEVIDYVIRKYGADRVAQIITFGKMKARLAIRDVGRALGVSLATVDKVAKLVPSDLKMTIEKALDISVELRQMYETDEQIKRLIDTAKAIEGLPRHSGVHAAGVVITDKPVSDYVPLQMSKDVVTTQYHMDILGELGLLKMDFLGLRNLTIIKNAVDNIKMSRGEVIDIENIDLSRKEVYEMISEGDTLGVFQLESGGMKNFMKELCPENLEDIIAGISLYRPGPMDEIPTYIRNKTHPENITYKHEKLKPILSVTYGCMVYQEQIMQIVRSLAGYSFGRADLVRRAMSKKKIDVMEKERDHFVNGIIGENGEIEVDGAVRRGIDKKTANEIFDSMMSFAQYAFNKSHAACYAVVAYQTAYLKRFYTAEYMAALMSAAPKISDYTADCSAHKIKLLPPDINKSFGIFTVENGAVRFGLGAIKNVGHKIPEQIAAERKRGGEFAGFTDFLERMSATELNKRAVEGFIKCGAFDCFGINRRSLMNVYEQLLSSVSAQAKSSVAGQMSLFDEGEALEGQNDDKSIVRVKEYDKKELLSMEKDATGLYLSGHPLDDYREVIAKLSSANISQINELAEEDEGGEFIIKEDGLFKDGDYVTIGGIITSRRNKTTKNNTQMAFLTFEDLYSDIEVIVFPKMYEKFSPLMAEDSLVFIKARISLREDEAPKLVCEQIIDYESYRAEKENQKKTLYIKLERGKENLWEDVKQILLSHKGDICVKIFFEARGETRVASKNLWCSDDNIIIEKIGAVLGKDCVKML